MSEQNNNLDQIKNIIFGEESQKIDKRFAQYEKILKEFKNQVNESLDELDQKIDKLNNRLTDIEQSTLQEIKKSKSALEQTIASQVEMIEEKLGDLTNEKTDKHELANMLLEVAMNLKGENLMNAITQEVSVEGKE